MTEPCGQRVRGQKERERTSEKRMKGNPEGMMSRENGKETKTVSKQMDLP